MTRLIRHGKAGGGGKKRSKKSVWWEVKRNGPRVPVPSSPKVRYARV